MVNVKDSATSQTVQENQFDARMFRTVRKDYAAGTLNETRHFYYSPGWQCLEERLGTSPDSANPERQHVWGLRYIDDLVLRDRDTDANGTLDERLYGCQDANWNMLALINTTAVAQERYLYSPFGMPTFLDGTMSTIRVTSAIASDILFTGHRFDLLTSLHLFRYRWFDSQLGFTIRDPLGYPDGPNAYAGWFVPNDVDPLGFGTYCGAASFSVLPLDSCWEQSSMSDYYALQDAICRERFAQERIEEEKIREEYFRVHTIRKVYMTETEIMADSLSTGDYRRTRTVWTLVEAVAMARVGAGARPTVARPFECRPRFVQYSTDPRGTLRTQYIYKAPQPRKGHKLLNYGFHPDGFSDPQGDFRAYFAKQRPLAEEYNCNHYEEGVLHIEIPQIIYDLRIKKHETPYISNPRYIEIPIPHEDFDVLNNSPRRLYEK